MTKAGIATIAGKPNAGKSTLLNRLVGQKLGIVSPKPQSTRDRVAGILSDENSQIVLLDTPGLLEPTQLLQRAMKQTARAALSDADVIVHLIDAAEPEPESLQAAAALSRAPSAPVLTAFNKIDVLPPNRLAVMRTEYPDALFISALNGDGVGDLLDSIRARLPESPFLYPADDASAQDMRFFVRELIRETALERLEQEVPYGIACEIEEFRESGTPVYIRAVLHVERKSQKNIVIGAGGSQIREIGRASRMKIEELVGGPVFLDLWVKVLPNWSRNETHLRRLGYNIREEPQQ